MPLEIFLWGKMINLLAVLLGAGGLLTYLYGLYRRYQQLKQKIAQAEAQATMKNDLEEIAKKAKVADEKVIDFDRIANEFESNNGPSKK